MELYNNTERGAFELPVKDEVAFISYRTNGKIISLLHTEVPEEMEGQGIGSSLVEKTFKYLEANNLKIVPRCAFVITYLKRHPEWNKLVDDSAGV